MDFNNNLPEWGNEGAEPNENLRTSGFQGGYKPPATVFNWFWNKVINAITELQTKLSGEEAARTNADTVLQTNINAKADKAEVTSKLEATNIIAGENVTVTTSGSNVTISAAGGSSANITKNPADTTGDIINTHLTVGCRESGTIGEYSLTSGEGNTAGYHAAAVGGSGCCANGTRSAVTGGFVCIANGMNSAVAGGCNNTASGDMSAIVGGNNNSAGDYYAVVAGGGNNHASGSFAAILGGNDNSATGQQSAVVGGYDNSTGNTNAAVVGGTSNTASGYGGVVIGGSVNKASGNYGSAVIGGSNNTALDAQVKIGHYSSDGTAGIAVGTTGDAFIIGNGTDLAKSNAFRTQYDGKSYGLSAFAASGADYAEMWEIEGGNPGNEDLRGYFVTVNSDNKIYKASPQDNYILGIVSSDPCMLGDCQSEVWQGMYLKDVFGRKIIETVTVPESVDEKTGETVPAYEYETFKINPDYDPEQEYIRREERPEWVEVGLLGKIVALQDGTCAAGGFCKVTDGGIATSSTDISGWRVLKVIDDEHILVMFR